MLSDHLSHHSGGDFYKEKGLETHLRLKLNFWNVFMLDKSIIIPLTRCLTYLTLVKYYQSHEKEG